MIKQKLEIHNVPLTTWLYRLRELVMNYQPRNPYSLELKTSEYINFIDDIIDANYRYISYIPMTNKRKLSFIWDIVYNNQKNNKVINDMKGAYQTVKPKKPFDPVYLL